MKTFHCTCGNTLFFENTQCLRCGHEVGWCPACENLTAIAIEPAGGHRCGLSSCGALLVKCHNYAVEHVCNRCIVRQGELPSTGNLCDYCRFNDTIPDLSLEGNREKWARLEAAKRRLLYSLDVLGLPYGTAAEGIDPPLSFDFKSDTSQQTKWWWTTGEKESVHTGHANGKITINIREADPVELEKNRVSLNEAHRTVIGHFRHEIGHYYWQMLVQGQCEDEFKAVFGDHESPNYAVAMEAYYQNGPAPNWQQSHVSAYASMHPWEDFAETFATYLDMVSVLDTAGNVGVSESFDPGLADLDSMVARYQRLGIVINELNRSMGLLDLVPEIMVPAVVDKMRCVHNLVRGSSRLSQQVVETLAETNLADPW